MKHGKKIEEMQSRSNEVILLFFIFIFYLIISRLLIFSGDDWAWGGTIGYARLEDKFDAYNGRYIGNLIILAITRNMAIRVIVYAFVNTGIIFFIKKILNNKVSYIHCYLFILLIPVTFYSQTYGWLAGFANYNVSTFLLLWIIWLLKKGDEKVSTVIGILILAVVNQFFVENVSIASILLAIFGLIIALFFKEKIYPYISWLLGTIFGAMIMFSNSGYHAQNNMRGLSNVDLNSFITSLLTDWTELYVKENALLLLLFAIVIYFLIENKNMFKNILFFFPTVYFVIRYILNISWANQSLLVLLFELLLIIIFLFSLIFIVGRSNIDGKNKRYFFIFLVISLVLVGPFLVVKPFGPRNILSSYIFLVLALLELVVALPIDFSAKKHQRVIRALVITLSCICLGMQATNKYVEHQRVMELRQDVKKEKTEIRFMRLPYEFLGHDLTPPDGSVQSNRQKSYHNVPRDTKLDIVDYQDPKLMELRQKNDSQ